jgi:hypothetical protein
MEWYEFAIVGVAVVAVGCFILRRFYGRQFAILEWFAEKGLLP